MTGRSSHWKAVLISTSKSQGQALGSAFIRSLFPGRRLHRRRGDLVTDPLPAAASRIENGDARDLRARVEDAEEAAHVPAVADRLAADAGISVIHMPPAYEPPDGGVCKRLRVSALTSFGSPDETHAAKCAKSENETWTLPAGASAGGNWFSGTGSAGVSFSPSPR